MTDYQKQLQADQELLARWADQDKEWDQHCEQEMDATGMGGEQMKKIEMAKWLATVTFCNGDNTFNGKCPTHEAWVKHFMAYTMAELRHELKRYGC